jgi:hypothetical protein
VHANRTWSARVACVQREGKECWAPNSVPTDFAVGTVSLRSLWCHLAPWHFLAIPPSLILTIHTYPLRSRISLLRLPLHCIPWISAHPESKPKQLPRRDPRVPWTPGVHHVTILPQVSINSLGLESMKVKKRNKRKIEKERKENPSGNRGEGVFIIYLFPLN